MLLKIFAATAVTVALAGAAAAQEGPSAGLPPLNSGTPNADLPPVVGAPATARTGTATNTAAQVANPEASADNSIKDALGREIGKMGKTNAPAGQPLGALDLGKDAGYLAPSLMRPGSGMTTYSGQSSNWIPK